MYSLKYKVTTSTCDSEGKLKLYSALQMMQDCSEMWIDSEPEVKDYFSLCVMDKSFKKQMAYLGSVSGRDEDKIGKAGLTPIYADNTVYFEEAKLVLVCKKLYQSELQESGFLYQDTIDANYPQRDFHTMYVGKIEKVLVRDDEYLK